MNIADSKNVTIENGQQKTLVKYLVIATLILLRIKKEALY